MPTADDRIQAFADVLRRLSVVFVQVAAERSAAHDAFSKQDLLTLGVLGIRGPSRMGEIADHLGLVRGAVTAIVDRLEEAGVVQRRRSDTDRRVWLVELTTAGQDVFEADSEAYRQVAKEMLAPLSAADQNALVAILERMQATAPE